jgi:hypothetical protein
MCWFGLIGRALGVLGWGRSSLPSIVRLVRTVSRYTGDKLSRLGAETGRNVMRKNTRSRKILTLNKDSLRLVAASDLVDVHGGTTYPATEYDEIATPDKA